MIDGCKVALNSVGYGNVPVIIGETGWPTAGGKDTNNENAKTYNDQVL
jgi:exo-beta-1,3-glucanase (GH17 family)